MCSQAAEPTARQRLADVRAQVEGVAAQAKEKLVPLAGVAVQKARPVVDVAFAKVSDVVDTDIKPRLAEWREQAIPVVEEATQRGRLAVVALKGDVDAEPEPVAAIATPKRRRHPILKTLGIAAILAALALLVRALLDARDEGWELQDAVFEDAPAAQPDQGEPPADANRYGEGCYIGHEPPEGFIIKGNDRSMKYHVPTALGYERCVTDVWFNSEEAAQQAGFTRALR